MTGDHPAARRSGDPTAREMAAEPELIGGHLDGLGAGAEPARAQALDGPGPLRQDAARFRSDQHGIMGLGGEGLKHRDFVVRSDRCN